MKPLRIHIWTLHPTDRFFSCTKVLTAGSWSQAEKKALAYLPTINTTRHTESRDLGRAPYAEVTRRPGKSRRLVSPRTIIVSAIGDL